MFSLEIYGRTGKLQIDGLGGSYGIEKLTYYRMLPQMGPPETTVWEFPEADRSWTAEFQEFLEDIRTGREPAAGLAEARAALAVVADIYRRSDYHFTHRWTSREARCASRLAGAARICPRTTRNTVAFSLPPPSTNTST